MHRVMIIGGGVHGTFFSHILFHHLGITDHVVIDPYERPLHVWRRHTSACGMSHLRSPSAHNLDVDYRALRRYAESSGWTEPGTFIPPYARPSLALFDAHCDHLVVERRLDQFRLRATVEALRLCDNRVEALTEVGTVAAETVVLALGRDHSLCLPEWARDSRSGRITHLFAPDCPPVASHPGSTVIVGAGVSGVQRALAESRRHRVLLVSDKPIVVRRFDSDPCYIGPKCYERFLADPTYAGRRRMIDAARYPGTIPEELEQPLNHAIADGRIELILGQVHGLFGPAVATGGSDRLRLRLSDGREIPARQTILATGFAPDLPALIRRTAEAEGLPCHEDGFPVLDGALRWHPRIVVTGRPAESELGPSAPNIIGAINAAKRLVPLFVQGLRTVPAWTPLVRVLDPTTV